jgi:hypothetical protein
MNRLVPARCRILGTGVHEATINVPQISLCILPSDATVLNSCKAIRPYYCQSPFGKDVVAQSGPEGAHLPSGRSNVLIEKCLLGWGGHLKVLWDNRVSSNVDRWLALFTNCMTIEVSQHSAVEV